MQFLGDKSPGATITFHFTTADSDGAPTALSSGTISVYKDSSNTESTSGVTLTASADSRTGMNRVAIDTSSDGTFYSAGSDFSIVLTAGTVDGTSVVGYVVGRFTLRESAAYDAVAAGVAVASIANNAITASAIASNAITADKIAADAIGASELAADAVTEIQSGLATSSALATVDGIVDDILVDTGTTIPGLIAALNNLSAGDAADAVLDEVVEGSTTMRQLLRGFAAALLAKASGLDTTSAKFRDLGDSKDRITATVDSDGNRAAVTLDLT